MFLSKLWVAVRFVLFGVGGFVFMFVSWVALLDRMTGGHDFSLNPLLSVAFTVLGAVAMLYGVGGWGRWGYVLVFLSIPCSMFFGLLPMFKHSGKGFGMVVPAMAAGITYFVVRKYYDSRRKKELSTATNP